MYDELVKRLRNRRICIQQSGSLDDFPLLQEAADAIEELSVNVRAQKAVLDKFPNWIPVTERLPKHDNNALICYEWTGRSGTVYREVGIASIEELERDPTEMFRPIAWMPLPQPPKEAD